MILILILVALGVVGLAGYLLDGWVAGHGLAVASAAGQWSIEAEGWAALWHVVSLGVLLGTVAGVAVGLMLSGHVARALAKARDAALDDARAGLQAREAELTQRIVQSTKEARQDALRYADEAHKSEELLLREQRKRRIIEGRLKGAQQKASRIQKQARLTSV